MRSTTIAILAAIALTAAYILGQSHGASRIQSKWDTERQQAIAAHSNMLINGINESYKLGLQYEEKQQEVIYVTKTLVKEIAVTMQDSSTCPRLPPGYGSLYNKAASVADGDPAFRQLDAASAAALLDRELR